MRMRGALTIAISVAILLILRFAASTGDLYGSETDLRVAAAANVTKPFTEIGALYQRETGQKVVFIFGATGLLAKQIENSAPFDVFAAANEADVARLDKEGLTLPETQRVYARGRLVLWTRKGGPPCPRALSQLTAPVYAHIALANPDVAPYGLAAREAMQAAKLWDTLRPRLVYGENIQQAFQFAQSGNADVAFAALSQAIGSGGAYVPVPEKLYAPILQAVAALKSSSQPDAARRFVTFLGSPAARSTLRKYGYALPPSR